MLKYLLGAGIAFVVSFLLSLALRRLSPRLGLVDKPNQRKIHASSQSIGGLAPVGGFLATYFWGGTPSFAFAIGLVIVTLTGLVDDIRGLGAWSKLVLQVLAALPLVMLMELPSTSFGPEFLLEGKANLIFLVFWIVGITNAYNLIDGLDGLAGGIALITAAAALMGTQPATSNLALAGLIGAILAFLLFNSYPAQLFLGDGGAYFLGFTLAFLTVYSLQTPAGKSAAEWSLIAGGLLVGIPILDTTWAIARRVYQSKGVFQSDSNHIHHRLLEGMGHRKSVFVLYVLQICAVMGGLAYWWLV
ncbi:MAG: glycosyltransferase family 4 protein [Candidatus Bipolaricaulota bacterium]